MPLYQFKDPDTQEIIEKFMSLSSREEFLKENPRLQPVISAPAIVAGVGGFRNDDGWKETLNKIATAHPASALANEHGSKSAKAVETRQAVDRWRKTQSD